MRPSLAVPFGIALSVLAPSVAAAQPTPGSGTWASQLVELADLVKPTEATCSDHCWVLSHLRLSGAMDKGSVDFTLDGALLAKGAYNIPLFAPAAGVRLEAVKDNGAPATLSFEDGHYYFHTGHERFTLTGKLVLPEDRTVTVVGPINALDVDVTGGRLTEGTHLSALAGTALHFDAEGDAPAPQPPVFSVARAVRVGKSIDIEYKLNIQSGQDLGVVRFPLRYGERVLDVMGATGWRIEGEELLLPTQGKHAEVTITGTLSNVGSFAPDSRAAFEWWLLESDAEHRVLATGDAKQHDLGESPIVRSEPNSRLYLVQRGQHLDVTVQTLQSLDVLAATVRSHSRQVIFTATGDVVMQDVLGYDNNGIDYLYYTPDGKPLYLATDGASERVMHKDGSDDLMIPMRMGPHTVTVQSLTHVALGSMFGRLAISGPRVPLATGSEDVTFGLPATLHPMVVTGGEQTTWPLGVGDAIAFVLAALASALAFRGWKRRSLGTATLIGLWLVSKPVFVLALGAGGLVLLWPALAKLSKSTRRVGVALALLGSVVVGLPLATMKSDYRASSSPAFMGPVAAASATMAATESLDKNAQGQAADTPNMPYQRAIGGMLDGVRPVAVTLPSYANGAYASQQLVTPERAFTPVVYYLTDAGLALLLLVWLACAGCLAWLQRDRLVALRDGIRVWLTPKPAVETAPTPAPAE